MNAAFKHISKDSLQNALKVLEDIITAVHKADRNPEFYNPDKYKKNNDGSFRSFEKPGTELHTGLHEIPSGY